jgi:hypothetical protein
VQRFARFIGLGGLLVATTMRADVSLDAARRAQVLLGSDVWSEVIRVENRARPSRYPREFHALVFELAGVLWFYTSTDGTQSFSLHRGLLTEEKADFAPLLRAIEPGFQRWSVVTAEAPAPGKLPKGCFIESVAALRARLARGEMTMQPRLLCYYVEKSFGLAGHTVLAYATRDGVEVIDPDDAPPVRLDAALTDDALTWARALRGSEITRARFVPLDEFTRGAIVVAKSGGRFGDMRARAVR